MTFRRIGSKQTELMYLRSYCLALILPQLIRLNLQVLEKYYMYYENIYIEDTTLNLTNSPFSRIIAILLNVIFLKIFNFLNLLIHLE